MAGPCGRCDRRGPGLPFGCRDLLDHALRRADRAETVAAANGARLADAKRRAEALAVEVTEATEKAARLDALVTAIRLAPAVALRESLGRLGDISPVALSVDDAGELSVQIDGRDWRCASQGRRVVAGLVFRDALRRAVGMKWLTVVVDDAQLWTGDLPAVKGPVIVLRGVNGADLAVSA